MTTTMELLTQLRRLDIHLTAQDGKLRVKAASGALTPALREEIAARKEEILTFLSGARAAQETLQTPLTHVGRDRDLPLSFSQQRLWFLDQMLPEGGLYNISIAVRIRGKLNRQALQESLEALVARHEALRTTFKLTRGVPMQRIAAPGPLPLAVTDLRAVLFAEREDQARQILTADLQKSFDLAHGPVFRSALLQLEDEHHVMQLTLHHIIADGWSLGVLWRDLGQMFFARSQGDTIALEPLPTQFADFADWQRQWLSEERLNELFAHWKNRLGDNLNGFTLPTDRPRPAHETNHGALLRFSLPLETADTLRQLSKRHDVTLFTTLLTLFKVLLHRYTGQNDIIVGTPVHGRNRVELENLIGCFVNMLVLRDDLSNNLVFTELLARVHRTVLDALAHQDLPFEYLVERLKPERDLSRNPLFQIMFILQNTPVMKADALHLSVETFDLESNISKVDLSLIVTEYAEGLWCELEYNTDLFERETIERLASHYRNLVESVIQDAGQKLSDMVLLSADERRRLLVDWNQTGRDYELTPAHRLFEKQAARRPEALAVRCGAATLTYGELNSRANQVAHYLIKQGVQPDAMIGLCVERSVEMFVALLGVLKAGGAYVPLDPAYPAQRLAYMLENSGAKLLVTNARLEKELPAHSAHVVRLDLDWPQIAAESVENPQIEIALDSLVYVIYTSGSTGNPKGVQIPHRALSNFVQTMREMPGMNENDTLLAITTYSFDLSVLDLYLPLTTGACIELAHLTISVDGVALARLIEESGATFMQATPATWKLLIKAGWQGSSRLKIICGGEAMPPDLARPLIERSASLWNMYGPTETTVWSTGTQVIPGEETITIGRPIANTWIYILDANQKPLPIGMPGELCIGGLGLARGYYKLPELTESKFVPNPFRAGERMFRTGDIGRYLPDGRIECLGRIDHQIKLRGFRIELGEIESALRNIAGIREAAVAITEYDSDDKRLTAYLVGPEPPEAGAIRSALREHLPDYMIPSTFMTLEALPLTPNGKIDRKALPRPEAGAREAKRTFAAPTTPMELLMAEIWQKALSVDAVGVHDNFFDLGGHSLLTIQVISNLKERTGIEIKPAEFMMQTMGQIAALCDQLAECEPVTN